MPSILECLIAGCLSIVAAAAGDSIGKNTTCKTDGLEWVDGSNKCMRVARGIA